MSATKNLRKKQSSPYTVTFSFLIFTSAEREVKRVLMGLTDRRKTAKNLVDSRKNWKILTVSRK